jgi:hypothetical protein
MALPPDHRLPDARLAEAGRHHLLEEGAIADWRFIGNYPVGLGGDSDRNKQRN